MSNHIFKTVALGMGLILAAVSSGCRSSEVELATVTGRVTMNGEPLPQALVRFTPDGGGRVSSGVTDKDGNYRLLYSARDEGALVGPGKIAISTGDPEMADQYPETVPARYNEETTLIVEITPGHNEQNFELQSH